MIDSNKSNHSENKNEDMSDLNTPNISDMLEYNQKTYP